MPYKLSEPLTRTNEKLHDELIASAENLVPILKERAAAANEARKIPVETINDSGKQDSLKFFSQKDMEAMSWTPIHFLKFK